MHGEPALNCRAVCDYLPHSLPETSVDTHSTESWLTQALDLSSLDFFLWSCMKHQVYNQNFENEEHLLRLVTATFVSMTIAFSFLDAKPKTVLI